MEKNEGQSEGRFDRYMDTVECVPTLTSAIDFKAKVFYDQNSHFIEHDLSCRFRRSTFRPVTVLGIIVVRGQVLIFGGIGLLEGACGGS